MGRGTELSIFSFGREENTKVVQPKDQSAAMEGGDALATDELNHAPVQVLDLGNLTPETLDAFFPSERGTST
jgi:hypothetical protein